MDAYVTEEQQWEAIKQWFNRYGNMVSWVLIGILSVVAAAQYWRHHQMVVREQASEYYMELLMSVEKNDKITLKNKAQILIDQYPSSPYASLANLFLASEEVTENNLVQAEKDLRWVLDKGSDQLQPLARIRLMNLLIAQNKLEDALKLYDETRAQGYLTLMLELKGDILAKQKQFDEALKYYERALTSAPEEGMHGPLLKMKIEELGGNTQISVKSTNQAKIIEGKSNEKI